MLIDMVTTVSQRTSLSKYHFDGMENLVGSFRKMMDEFRSKRHDFLDFQNNRFDRDYAAFIVRILDLEQGLKQFISH